MENAVRNGFFAQSTLDLVWLAEKPNELFYRMLQSPEVKGFDATKI
jgi:hypothetical protein